MCLVVWLFFLKTKYFRNVHYIIHVFVCDGDYFTFEFFFMELMERFIEAKIVAGVTPNAIPICLECHL